MKKQYAWSRHIDDELWQGGPCDSISECVDEALYAGFSIKERFAIGLMEKYSVDVDFADQLIERLQEDAYDEVGDASYDWLDSVPKEQVAELNSRITDVVLKWLDEIHEAPYFYKVLPIKELTLEQAMEQHAKESKKKAKGRKVANS